MADTKKQLAAELEAINQQMTPIVRQTTTLEVTDAQSYALADALLAKITAARKVAKERMGKIINPLKEALKEAQDLLKEVTHPLDTAEESLRDGMGEFKRLERAKEREEQEKREAEAAKLRAEAVRKQQAELKARTQAMRDRLAQQRAELETQADLTEAAPVAPKVQVAHSNTRIVKNAVVENWTMFLMAVVAGKIPLDTVSFDLRGHYRADPEGVEKWPGVKIEEDVQIVQRGR